MAQRRTFARGLVFVVIGMTILTSSSLVNAATYTFSQSSWSGGATGAAIAHNPDADNNTTGTVYSPSSNVVAGATVTMASSTTSLVQTDDTNSNTGFNLSGASTTNKTAVVGTGSSASIQSAQDLTASTSVTFGTTGAVQSWTVPANVYSIRITASGATGGGTWGGRGGLSVGTLSVVPGTTYYYSVGSSTAGSAGGYGGGGSNSGGSGHGGGGMTWFSAASTFSTSTIPSIVLVAGGGGGDSNSVSTPGGAGGGTSGANGVNFGVSGGGGGSQVAGGAAGGTGATAGAFSVGGTGSYAGGGGGGFYGGGGGAWPTSQGSGGGGSGYTSSLLTSTSTTAGAGSTGNGSITIQTLPPYFTSSTYTSGIIDTGAAVANWGNLSWVNSGSTSTSVIMRVRSGNSPTLTDAGAFTTDIPLAWNAASSTLATNIIRVSCVGNICYAAGDGGKILKSLDSGATWGLQTSGTTNNLSGIYCVDANTCYAGGTSGKLLKTTNGGSTSWVTQTSPLSYTWARFSCVDANNCYATASNVPGMIKTSDGGSNWVATVSLPGGGTGPVSGVFCRDANNCFVAGAALYRVYSTTNGGSSWSQSSTLSSGNPLNEVVMTTSTNGYIVGGGGIIYKTTNNGASWVAQTSNTSNPLYEIACTDDSHCFAVGLSGTIVKTIDGTNWSVVPSGTANSLQGVACSDITHCTTVGNTGTIIQGAQGSPTPLTTLGATNNTRYIQYQTTLNTTNPIQTPSLDSVTIGYTQYATSSYLISSPFNANDTTNVLAKIQWNGMTPGTSVLKFQLATSTDNSTWGNFVGPDGLTTSYFTTADGSDVWTNANAFKNSQWFKYKAYLLSDGSVTPMLMSATTTYVVNAPPAFDATYGTNGVSISQSSTADATWGKVVISYKVKDVDTNLDAGSINKITPSFEYSTTSGATWAPITSSYLAGTDLSQLTISTSTYATGSATWDAKSQLGSLYSAAMKVRVSAFDGQAANATSTAASALFTLDIQNPVGGLTFDAGVAGQTNSGSVTVNTPSDNNSVQYLLSDGTSTVGWTSISSTTTIPWTFDAAATIKSLRLQLRDSFGNTTASTTYSTALPTTPDGFFAQDISKQSTNNWREFVAWSNSTSSDFASYKLEYATSSDGNTYGAYVTVTDPTFASTASSTNFYTHSGLTGSLPTASGGLFYRYHISVVNTAGNTSIRTIYPVSGNAYITTKPDGAQNYDEGGTTGGNGTGGGAGTTAPTVQFVVPTQSTNTGTISAQYQLYDPYYASKISPSYEGYILYNTGVTVSSALSGTITSIPVSDSSHMPTSGFVEINNEVLKYTSKAGNTLSGLTRGAWPTIATTRQTAQSSVIFQGTPVWIVASSTTPVAIATSSALTTGQSGTITWNTQSETTLAGLAYTNVGVRVLVHDNQTTSVGPISTQSAQSTDGTLGTLDMSVPAVNFTLATSSISEASSTLPVAITLTKSYPLPVTITLTTSGTSILSSDYTLSTTTISIPAGATSTTVSINPINDSLPGTNHTVILTMASPVNTTIGSTGVFTATINESNNIPVIGFASASSTVSEASTTVSIPVILNTAAGQTTSIGYTVSGTAVSGVNYAGLVNGTATIAAGATSTTISFTLRNDAVAGAATATVILALSNPINSTLGAVQYTLTINELTPNPSVQFTQATASGLENIPSISIPVSLSGTSTQSITVTYTVSASSTAVAGTNYILANGTATIPAGSASTTIVASIINNPVRELDKTLIVSLGTATGATLGAASSYTYTIQDIANTAAPVVTNVLPVQNVSNGSIVVGYTLTDTAIANKIAPSYEGYVFYSIGTTVAGSSTSTISVSNASHLPAAGFVQINNEVIGYTSKTGDTLNGVTRGTWPTPATARSTRQNASILTGTPIWVMASSTMTTIATTSVAAGQNGSITWNAQNELSLIGSTYTNVGVRVLVHDNQATSTSALSSQSDQSNDGILTLLDLNVPTIQFSTTSISTLENANATTTITVTLSKTYSQAVSATYAVAGGTAAINTDYLITTPGTVTIPAGATSTTLAIVPVHDNTYSSQNKTVSIALTAPNNSILGTSTTFTVTIVETDAKPPTVNAFRYDGRSGVLTGSIDAGGPFTYVISNNADMTPDLANASSGIAVPVSASVSFSMPWNMVYTSTGIIPTTTVYTSVYLVTNNGNGNVSTTTIGVPAQPQSFAFHDSSDVSNGAYQELLTWKAYATSSATPFASYNLYRSTDGTTFTPLSSVTDSATNSYLDTGLASSTTYYYKMTVTDTAGDTSPYSSTVNDIPDGFGSTRLTPPVITGVSATNVHNVSATINWTTDEQANSTVKWSTDTSYSNSTTTPTLVTDHAQVITGLTPNSVYLFRVQSTDVSGNTADISSASGTAFTFTTTGGAIVTQVQASTTINTATVTWHTNKDSDSVVLYSPSSNFNGSYQVPGVTTPVGDASTTNDFLHTVTITGLQSAASYWYKVQSSDSVGNVTTDDNSGFYYVMNTLADTFPPVISNISEPIITSQGAVIFWQTDKLATSQVIYGADPSSLLSDTGVDQVPTVYHSMTISKLTQDTPYYFQIKTMGGNHIEARSTTTSFTTTKEGEVKIITVGGGGSGQNNNPAAEVKDTTPPVISNITVASTTPFGATITYTTDEPSVGSISYGRDATYGDIAGEKDFTTNHSFILSGLRIGAEYHFQIQARDKSANASLGEDQTFKTKYVAHASTELKTVEDIKQYEQEVSQTIESILPGILPPFVETAGVTDITENSAIISWRTNISTYGVVSYSTQTEYASSSAAGTYTKQVSDIDTKKTDHSLLLTGLLPNTQYHFKVKSFSLPQVVGEGKDMTFETKASKVSASIIDIKNTSFRVLWSTDQPASTIVEYKNVKTGITERIIDDKQVTSHEVLVDRAIPAATYEVRVFGYTAAGNLIESGAALTVVTSRDIAPPKIASFKVDGALVPGRTDRVQTVITWTTDEPSNSAVYYQEGAGQVAGAFANKSEQLDTYTTNHAIILSSLKPGTIYQMKVESTDQAGNKAVFGPRTIITPQKGESIFDVIFKNFEDTFKFLRGAGQ